VTIFNDGYEPIVKDGNKRTIAFYERRKELGDDTVEYLVFVVSPIENDLHPSPSH
jgi:hypothetical protein